MTSRRERLAKIQRDCENDPLNFYGDMVWLLNEVHRLEQALEAARKQHDLNCEIDMKVHGTQCRCGAASHNSAIDRALEGSDD